MNNRFVKTIALLLCFSLIFEQSGLAQIAGQLDISGYITSLRSSFIQDKFRPLHLRYLAYDTLNNNFKLLLDKGDTKDLKDATLKESTKTLLDYFFVGIALPNDSFWVNLRPDSQDNIIDDYLAQTDVGKILLEADLQLKKDTAQFTSPQTPEGKNYWDKLYQKAGELLGQENITIPTLVRPWIVPDEIIIRETKDNAYIYKATLKVMLEEDYLKGSSTYNFSDSRLKALNQYSSQLLKERIIPKLTKEINTSKRYAALRQAYYSLILAQWFKARFYGKGGLYSYLIDKKNLTGLMSPSNWSKTTYFKEYQKSFKDGEYNVKEPVSTSSGQSVRSYFSGGMQLAVILPQPGQTVIDPTTSSAVTSISTKRPRALNGMGDQYIAGIATGTGPEGLQVELETRQVGTGAERAQASRSASSPAEKNKAATEQRRAVSPINQAAESASSPESGEQIATAKQYLEEATEKKVLGEAFPEIAAYFSQEDLTNMRIVFMDKPIFDSLVQRIGYKMELGMLSVDTRKTRVSSLFNTEFRDIINNLFDQSFVIIIPRTDEDIEYIRAHLVHEIKHYLQGKEGQDLNSGLGLSVREYWELPHEEDAVREEMRYLRSQGYDLEGALRILTGKGKILLAEEQEYFRKIWQSISAASPLQPQQPASASSPALELSEAQRHDAVGVGQWGKAGYENISGFLVYKEIPTPVRMRIINLLSDEGFRGALKRYGILIFDVTAALRGNELMMIAPRTWVNSSVQYGIHIRGGLPEGANADYFYSASNITKSLLHEVSHRVWQDLSEDERAEFRRLFDAAPAFGKATYGDIAEESFANWLAYLGTDLESFVPANCLEYIKSIRAKSGVPLKIVAASSPAQITSDKGGIDLRALPITTQPINSSANLRDSPLPVSGNSLRRGQSLSNVNPDTEWSQIQNMLQSGIIPSSERIKEYLGACCVKDSMDKEIDKVLACIADILRLEEERCQITEAGLKELLVLLESDKPVKDMQRALINITILPKEPAIKP